MRLSLIALLTALPVLAACAPPDFPEDRVFGDSAPRTMPELEPVDAILAAAAEDDGRTADATTELQDRGARLRDRADALRAAQP
ncbi:hypothetical protein ACVDG3_00030 [Meridianimarinicoccus sp. RP-17]|uniref:hypothetical protein n=1 Tax=Meridianimarinicoccus zhengii TaxID=2056810 RepID=UPI000DAC92F4|nr:hypothetical protein [Phycocomes zhengii]